MEDEKIDQFLKRASLRQIEVAFALCKYGSMQGAAKALRMSVSNVSQISRRFEHNLGFRIFAGDKRRSSIRPEAADLINRFGPLLGEIDRLRESLRTGESLLSHNNFGENLNRTCPPDCTQSEVDSRPFMLIV